MKSQDLKGKNSHELEEIMREKREKLRALRFDLAADKLKNHRQIRKTKKEIARIMTLLSSKEKNKQNA